MLINIFRVLIRGSIEPFSADLIMIYTYLLLFDLQLYCRSYWVFKSGQECGPRAAYNFVEKRYFLVV